MLFMVCRPGASTGKASAIVLDAPTAHYATLCFADSTCIFAWLAAQDMQLSCDEAPGDAQEVPIPARPILTSRRITPLHDVAHTRWPCRCTYYMCPHSGLNTIGAPRLSRATIELRSPRHYSPCNVCVYLFGGGPTVHICAPPTTSHVC